MLHIAIIADPIEKQSAGIHYYTKGLINTLAKYPTKVKLSVIMMTKDFPNSSVDSYILPNTFKFLKNDPYRTFITLPALINKINPDIVIEPAHFGPFNIHKHIKRVTVIHDLIPIVKPLYSTFFSVLLHKLLLKRILKNADLIITNSNYTNQLLVKHYVFVADKSVYIYPGTANDTVFNPINDFDYSALSSIKPKKYFLFAGTIEPRKNLISLLEAFSIFKSFSGTNDIKLVIAGGLGWKYRKILKFIKKHKYCDSIVLTGYLQDYLMPMLYSNAIAKVFPSYDEGFGIPVIEAMRCKCPLILSDIPIFREIAINNALFCNPHSIEEFSDAMYNLFTNQPSDNVLNQSLAHANNYSWELFGENLVECLNSRFL